MHLLMDKNHVTEQLLENTINVGSRFDLTYTKLKNTNLHWSKVYVPIETHLKLVLVLLVSITILLVQYHFRIYDDNRLLSWRWIMNANSYTQLVISCSLGLILAYKFIAIRLSKNAILIILFVLAFFIAMATWQTPEVIIDSSRYYIHANIIATKGIAYYISAWGDSISAWTDLPAVSIIYGYLFYLFAESRTVIQVFNALCFSLTVMFIYCIGRAIWQSNLGLYAAGLFLAIPYLHSQTAFMLVDVPSMFLVVFTIWVSLFALQKGGALMICVAVLMLFVTLLSKYTAWLTLGIILMLPLVISEIDWRITFSKALSIVAISISLILIVSIFKYDAVNSQHELLLNYQLSGLNRWQERHISTYFYQIHPFVSLAAVYSLLVAIKRHDYRFLIIVAPLAILLVAGVNRARYVLIYFPMLALMAAYGLTSISDQLVRKYVIVSGVLVSVLITLYASSPFLQSTSLQNVKNAGEYINALPEANVLAVATPQYKSSVNPYIAIPLLDYYAYKKFNIIENSVAEQNQLEKNFSLYSPVRFTWEQKPYPYSVIDKFTTQKNTIVAVIAADEYFVPTKKLEIILSSYVLVKQFHLTDKVFRFQTIVKIYRHTDNI